MSSYSSYFNHRFLYAPLFDSDNDMTEIEVSTSQTHHCLTFPRMDMIYSATFLDILCIYSASWALVDVTPYCKEVNRQVSYSRSPLLHWICFWHLGNMTREWKQLIATRSLFPIRLRVWRGNILGFDYKGGDFAPASLLHHSEQTTTSIHQEFRFQRSTVESTMQVSSLMCALVAVGASLGLATPLNDNSAATQFCPSGYSYCGVC
jgi:hypothetical protein